MRSWMIGIVVGILLTAVTPVLPPPGILVPIMLLVVATLLRHRATYGWLGGLLIGAALASWNAQQSLQARLPEACNGLAIVVTGRVVSLPRKTFIRAKAQRQRFEFVPDGVLPATCQAPRRILLSYYGDEAIQAGQRWQFTVKLRRPWGLANPGSFNMQSWFAQTGIDAVGSVRSGSEQLRGRAKGWGSLHHRLRARVSARIEDMPIAADARAVLRAVTVADKSGIDASLWQLFQQYGVNHLLVISGLHIGLAAGLGYLLGGLISRLGQLSGCHLLLPTPPILALLVAALYSALAGFTLATQRALLMLACFVIAGLLGRRSGAANNLLLAAVLLLTLNPLAALGSGFWLSFGAVAALLWLAQWQGRRGWSSRLLQTHLFMSLLMLSLGGFWFGGTSWVSAAANLFAIPLLGLWVVPLALLAALMTLVRIPLDQPVWELAAWPLARLLGPAAEFADRTPLFWHLSPGLAAMLLGISGVMLLVTPGRARQKVLVSVLLLPLLLPIKPEATGPRLVVLDVGQGTAAVLIDGERALLYDTGGGDPAGANLAQMVILPFLRSQGIRRLNTLVVSHGDSDHSAGLATVLGQMAVTNMRHGPGVSAPVFGRPCRAGEAWQWPSGIRFQFLSPAATDLAGGERLTSNDSSCVLQIEFGQNRILLAGDIESDREREIVRYWGETLDSQVLLVAHHGSRTSTTRTWLKWANPQLAIVSSGYVNRFGHPHREVVERLEGSGVRLHYTALEGALELRLGTDGTTLLSAYREGIKPWWM